MKKITEDWLKAGDDDLRTVRKLLDDEYLYHIVAFHCQQSVEKYFKAIIEECNLDFIKTHNLENLLGQIKEVINISIDYEIIEKLDSLYIDARYPSSFGLLPNGKPDRKEINLFIQFVESIRTQILDFLNL